ncbi:MAG: glycosyltransferase [Ignavibacteria bacterium]|nr:glycosyltransferase [Ignavibacteria bacterium]
MKIFYLTPRVPYPIDKGDKLRAFYQIKYLSQKNDIYLYSLDENDVFIPNNNPLYKYCKNIKVTKLSRLRILLNLLKGVFTKVPFQTSYYYSKEIKKDISKAIDIFQPDIIFCQLIRSAKFVEDITNIPKVIDYVDVISKGLERRIEKSKLFLKLLLKWELKRAIKYEKQVYDNFDDWIIITDEDKNLLPFNEKKFIKVIPNGIDLEFFHPIISIKDCDVLFSGNLSYPPNIDAAEFLVKEIMPLVWDVNPNISVTIAGAAPKNRILTLASDKIKIVGWTEDIRENYKKAKVFIAPLRIGTGLQNKLLQAMAMKLPCVVSDLTAKGITNENCDFMLVAKSKEQYANHIIHLLNDSDFSNMIAEKGFSYVTNNYNWEDIINNLDEIIKNVKR